MSARPPQKVNERPAQPFACHLGYYVYEVIPQPRGRLMRRLDSITMDQLIGSKFESGNVRSLGEVVGALGDGAYDVLSVFIEGLMPRWEWDGLISSDAHKRWNTAKAEHRAALDALDKYVRPHGPDDDSGYKPPDVDDDGQVLTDLENAVAATKAKLEELEGLCFPGDDQQDPSPDHAQILDAFMICAKANRVDLLGRLKALVDPIELQGFTSDLIRSARKLVRGETTSLTPNLQSLSAGSGDTTGTTSNGTSPTAAESGASSAPSGPS